MPVLDMNKLASEVFDIEAKAILKLKDSLGIEFDKAIDILYNTKGKVIITGMGKSGLIGKKIAATLTSTGTPSYFLHPAESTHGDSGIITRDDVVIAISNSGETQELLNLLPLIKRFGVQIISMTGNMESTLAKAGNVVLNIAVEKEACPLGKAPTASTTATLAMGDALAVCLLKKRGFTEEDFLIYHPGGALGKGIKFHVEDLMLKEELSQSEKDKSELLMIVDLERNDLNRVCRPGSVKVTELFEVETYATVFHLVSTIVGELETDKTVPDLIASTFPGGSITGAPKIRAMEIIDELEHSQRGLYTGSIGYLSLNGDCDLNIVIRTAVHQNGIYHLGVGGGITAESELEFEYDETWQKAKAVVAAIAGGDVHE